MTFFLICVVIAILLRSFGNSMQKIHDQIETLNKLHQYHKEIKGFHE
jgi:hypothetical protein